MEELRAKRKARLQIAEILNSLQSQVRCLARYNDIAESAFRQEIQELHDRHVREQGPLVLPERKPDDPFAEFDESGAIQDYYERILDEVLDLSQMIPMLHRWAAFAVSYSALECNLDRICRICARGLGAESDYSPDDREVISESCRYLSLASGSPFPLPPDSIEDLNCLRHIRNTLLHRDGHIREKHRQRLQQFATRHNDWVRISPQHNILVLRGVASLFVDLLDRVLRDAIGRVQEKLDS